MFRRDMEYGKDPTNVHKTASFNLPVRKYRSGPYKGYYKIPCGSIIYTCFTSDFFHAAADDWRPDAWDMMKERSDCTFFMITKRPGRIAETLPPDWGSGYDNVHISVTCENQYWADKRLPVFLPLPIKHRSITHEPMLEVSVKQDSVGHLYRKSYKLRFGVFRADTVLLRVIHECRISSMTNCCMKTATDRSIRVGIMM